jgi:hypothetical protein
VKKKIDLPRHCVSIPGCLRRSGVVVVLAAIGGVVVMVVTIVLREGEYVVGLEMQSPRRRRLRRLGAMVVEVVGPGGRRRSCGDGRVTVWLKFNKVT